jgi:hypothetical protein
MSAATLARSNLVSQSGLAPLTCLSAANRRPTTTMEWVQGRAGLTRSSRASSLVAAPPFLGHRRFAGDEAERRRLQGLGAAHWTGGRERRGPGEPVAHPERDGLVGGAGGGRTATQSTAASADTCGETADGGGDSGHLGPIPSRGRKRAARGSSRAGRRSLGRRGTVRAGGGHGGHARAREREGRGEGEGVSQGEGRKAGASGRLQVGSSVSRARAGGGNGGVQETSTQELPVSAKKTRGFYKNPPGLWGFSGKFESELFLQCLVIPTYFEKL